MISSEVQRTLVKSPPELWAELSEPAALARHLGEFGEIRITRIVPEQRVEWEAEDTTGTVLIKPSGWGTKVVLKVTRRTAEPDAGSAEPQSQSAAGAASGSTAAGESAAMTEAGGPQREPVSTLAPTPESESAHPEPGWPQAAQEPSQAPPTPPSPTHPPAPEPAQALDPEPDGDASPAPASQPKADGNGSRRGFLARLFGRRRQQAFEEQARDVARTLRLSATSTAIATGGETPEPTVPTPDPEPGAPAKVAAVEGPITLPEAGAPGERVERPQPAAQDEPTVAAALPADEKPSAAGQDPASVENTPSAGSQEVASSSGEEAGTERVTEVLTSMLDRLGAAHHRPFSRG